MKKLLKSLFVISIGVFFYEVGIPEVQAELDRTIITYKKFKVYEGGWAYEMMRHAEANRLMHEQSLIQMLLVRKLKFGEPLIPTGGKVGESVLLHQE